MPNAIQPTNVLALPPLSRVSTPQLRILLWRKIQPDSPYPFSERGLKLLSPSNIQCAATAFCHFPNLLIISEGQRAKLRNESFKLPSDVNDC